MFRRGGSRYAQSRRAVRRVLERFVVAPLEVAARVLPALPTSAALSLAEALGRALYTFDRRGRNAGLQNLEAVFGDEMPPPERRRVLKASYVNVATAMTLLFHAQPMTRERYARYVRIDPEDDARLKAFMEANPRIVVASAHFGNWEMALAARHALPYAPDMAYLTESTSRPRVDALFDRLRDAGTGGSARRKYGAASLRNAIEAGRSVSLLVDRNVRSWHGGRYVPFLGIPARTTPLPAYLGRWYHVPVAILVLLPEGRARWRLWGSPILSVPETDDPDADAAATTARINDVISRLIREKPEAWAWMLKRWKSRPTPELGPYPAYSLFDPDPEGTLPPPDPT